MPRDNITLNAMFDPLWHDIAEEDRYFREVRPLLAHYSSMHVLEQMMKNNEVWFGNPLFMNDIEEVKFGIDEGTKAFIENNEIRSALGASTFSLFRESMLREYGRFHNDHVFDTYILCLSEHARGDEDGLLSMWRGYGDAGKGVAIVFDGDVLSEQPNTPLIVSKVKYASREERFSWFRRAAGTFGELAAKNALAPDEIAIAAYALFARLRMFALFTKHQGFSEEREWRLAYLPERDPAVTFARYLGYNNGARGVEPKLKMKMEPVLELGADDISFERLVHSIILGPTQASQLAVLSTKRMLHHLGRSKLAERVVASRIPFRQLP